MESLKGAFKSILRVTSQVCNKHDRPFHYIEDLKTGRICCPECEKEKVIHPRVRSMAKHVVDQEYRGYLRKYSLVNRPSVFDCTFENFKHNPGTPEDEVYKKARMLAGFYYKYPDKNGNALFFGNAGAGKTHLAMAILNAINEKSDNPKQKCVILSMVALIKAMRNHFNDYTANMWSQDYAEEVVKNADLVVLDDLGAESADRQASNFVQGTLQNIYEDNQRIITTTNLSMDELRGTYHSRLISRFLEGGRGKTIDFSKTQDKRMWK